MGIHAGGCCTVIVEFFAQLDQAAIQVNLFATGLMCATLQCIPEPIAKNIWRLPIVGKSGRMLLIMVVVAKSRFGLSRP